MNPSVIFVEKGRDQTSELTTALEASGIQVLRCRSIPQLEQLCQASDRGVIVLDLDKFLVTNRVLRELSRKCPSLQLIGISDRPFHPELEEAMRSYLYASISKPVDVEELMYLVKSILRDLPPP